MTNDEIGEWYEREGESDFGPNGSDDPEGIREYYEREGFGCPISPTYRNSEIEYGSSRPLLRENFGGI